MNTPYVLYSTPTGDVAAAPRLRAIDYTGQPLQGADLIPLPAGTTLSMLPNRLACGLTDDGRRASIPAKKGWALAALLPIGYTRTHLPGYTKTSQTEALPFFGYTALAGMNGKLYVA